MEMKLIKPLPKSWAVECDGSKLFKDTVIKYINEVRDKIFEGSSRGWFYGDVGHPGSHQNLWQLGDLPNYVEVLSLQEFIDHFEQERKELPKYWVVKNDGSQLFKNTVVKYLNKISPAKWDGKSEGSWYGIDGSQYLGGTICAESIKGLENEPVKLTLEEFIKLSTNKVEKPMEKKIIGYKAPFDMPSIDMKKGDVFEEKKDSKGLYGKKGSHATRTYIPKEIVENWEPVYEEEELKVGDWVIKKEDVPEDYTMWKYAFKICKIEEGPYGGMVAYKKGSDNLYVKHLRKATEKEIAEAEAAITIGGFELNVVNEAHVKFGCLDIWESDLKFIEKLLRQYCKITYGDTEITIGLVDKVIKRMREGK